MKSQINIKRIYETPSKQDGTRILVDRLWPRGIKKENAHIDLWEKQIAPTNELRKWYAHEVKKWIDFKKKYTAELENNGALDGLIKECKEHNKITLLYAAKDEVHNNAVVLKELLDNRVKIKID